MLPGSPLGHFNYIYIWTHSPNISAPLNPNWLSDFTLMAFKQQDVPRHLTVLFDRYFLNFDPKLCPSCSLISINKGSHDPHLENPTENFAIAHRNSTNFLTQNWFTDTQAYLAHCLTRMLLKNKVISVHVQENTIITRQWVSVSVPPK